MWCFSKRIRILVIPKIVLMLMIWVQNTVVVLVHKTVSKTPQIVLFLSQLGHHHLLRGCQRHYPCSRIHLQGLFILVEYLRATILGLTKCQHGLPLDLPGRVFISKILEWTSSVIYYSKPEYLQAKHASDHEVRGSFALIFDPDDMSCCAVLELVSVKEKPYFNSKMKMFSFALLYTILQKLLFSCIFR